MAAAIAEYEDEQSLRLAYRDADREARIRRSRVGCLLVVLFVPLFWGLDWAMYPDRLWEFAMVRGLSTLAVLAIYALLWTRWGAERIHVLSVAWALSPAVAIAWMIMVADGAASPYHSGLNLVMIVVTLLMPWTVAQVVILCSTTVGMYILACAIQAWGGPLAWNQLINNLYFMITTAVICMTAGLVAVRMRWREFRLRHELDRRNQELCTLDRLKGEFYANVSHELRTPLTLILAPLQTLLADPALNRQVHQALTYMRDNALRLLRLVNDILEVVRMDSGRLELQRQKLDLAVWVPGIARSAQHLAAGKGLQLLVEGEDQPVPVAADPTRLEKVLLNLLSNAIKLTPAGGTVTVSWGGGDNNAQPWFAVRDTGIGIPAAELPHLFRRFHQVDNSATREYRGLGLGLSLSRDLVERHDGSLQVESVEGEGSYFRIELPPLDQQDEAVTAVQPTPEDALSPESAPESEDYVVATYLQADRHELTVAASPPTLALGQVLEPERATGLSDLVLIADDEPDLRHFLCQLLRRQYRVVLAGDGEQAVALASALQPALILMDLMMPRIDGMTACHRIRADEQACEARIILLTARADDDTRLAALQGGADDFLVKPFSSEEVLARSRNLLENAALQRSLRQRNEDLEEAMRRLRATEAQLVQSEKMNALGSLASGLLHEINNPLNYAQMAIEFASQNVAADDEVLKETLTDARDGMTRIGNVIQGLRSFAYPDHDHREATYVLAEAVAVARQFTAHQCQGMSVESAVDEGLRLPGSLNQISMVLVNLLTNASRAIRAAEDGRKGHIQIDTDNDAEMVRLQVRDNGIGMDEERIRRIFEPFYTTNEPGQGLGLGLAISHTIIRNHGGVIRIESQPGVGTTFILELPINAPSAATESSHG